MNQISDKERIQFGSRLREAREARAMTLGEVASRTKIPERSLERLEAGRFDELPAEVFVRGFVKSYARCVGLEAEDTLRRYGELSRAGGPVKRRELTENERALVTPGRAAGTRPPRTAAGSTPPPIQVEDRSAEAAPAEGAEPVVVVKKKGLLDTDELKNLSRAILEAGRETRRLPLTLAVIILVIVATLTMSLLLSRPSHVGDGLTHRPSPTAGPSSRADA